MFLFFSYFLISLCTRTRFIFSFLIHTHMVCVWKEKKFFSSFCYAHAHDSFLSLLYTCISFLCSTTFFLERHTHIFYLHCPWHRRPLSLPPAFRPLHRHPRTPAPLSTAGAHVSLSLASPPASVRFCSSHRCPCPPAPVDLLTTDDVPYHFVADKGNILHSIRTLCFPCRGRRHPHAFSQPVLTSHISWSSSSVRALSVRGLGHLVRP